MHRHLRLSAILCLSAALFAGCSSNHAKDQSMAAPDLYKEIQANLDATNYKTAIERLNTLQARFPFDDFGTQAQIDLIYANYMNQDFDDAVDAADRFIREHPRHPDVDYAYYMKGVAYFDPQVEFLHRWFGHDNFQRDPANSQKSFEAFGLLLERFPDSHYAADARQRMVFLRERLADFDWQAADWYMRRGAWVSALQRSYSIVLHYPQTPRTQDALQMMYSCYKKLGLDDLAASTQKLLETNFPGAPLEYTPRGPA
jgi:outer membrane protein assembly factor BamD